MASRGMKALALRHLADLCRNEPTDSPLWEGTAYSGHDPMAPDMAGVRAATAFATALNEIAGELERRAERLEASPRRGRR